MNKLSRWTNYTLGEVWGNTPENLKKEFYKCSDVDAYLAEHVPKWVSTADVQPPLDATVLWFYLGTDSDKQVSIQKVLALPVTENAYWMPLPEAPTDVSDE